ncbi:hypothetical protein [Vibrio metschnikovii]|uniref:hypothetical protein n=1 Tax=Vibrio metschnikovii TaxID=28172 RepID=UPI001C2F3E00|nr:hypothetical protein [Vibrio metschnikovii]
MNNLIDILMKLNASFPFREVAGHWDNKFQYVDADGEMHSEQYEITFLVDYSHMFFHISVAVDNLNDQFINELDNILFIADKHVKNLKDTVLSGEDIHFTRKLFIITNSNSKSYPKLVDSFRCKGISANVYQSIDDSIEMISPQITYVPLYNFEEKIIKGKKIPIFSNANYTIFEEEDGKVSYAYHVKITTNGVSNGDVLNQLSLLSQEKDNLQALLTNHKLRKKYTIVYATALRDVFEGHFDIAKKSLQSATKQLYNQKVIFNTLLGFMIYLIVLTTTFLSEHHISRVMEGLGYVVFFSVLGGFFSLFSTIGYFKQSGGYSKVELIIDLLVKIVVTSISGMLVYFVIRSNLIFGFLNTHEVYLIYLISFVSGWSEKFVSNLLTSVEKKFSSEMKI